MPTTRGSVSRRRAVLRLGSKLALAGLLGGSLGGCLRPMLAEDSPSADLIGRIRLPEFSDRFGYNLDTSLRERLGRTEVEEFRLVVETNIKRSGLAISQDSAVTRIRLTATADWKLFRVKNREPVMRGRAVSQSGYNSTASLFATRSAKLDIERRLARDLGERIARSVLSQAGGLAMAAGS
jgi:LPS-assembly lipoprotein